MSNFKSTSTLSTPKWKLRVVLRKTTGQILLPFMRNFLPWALKDLSKKFFQTHFVIFFSSKCISLFRLTLLIMCSARFEMHSMLNNFKNMLLLIAASRMQKTQMNNVQFLVWPFRELQIINCAFCKGQNERRTEVQVFA